LRLVRVIGISGTGLNAGQGRIRSKRAPVAREARWRSENVVCGGSATRWVGQRPALHLPFPELEIDYDKDDQQD